MLRSPGVNPEVLITHAADKGAVAARRTRKGNSHLLNSRFVTKDGRKLQIRLIRPSDAPLLIDFFYRLTPETQRRRFHYGVTHAAPRQVLVEAERLADVDNLTHGGAVLATEKTKTGEHIVGVVRLMRDPQTPDSPEAETAIVIRDDFQGAGLGRELLGRLVHLARHMKVRTMVADIEADNYPALRAFRSMGLPTESDTTHGETRLLLTVPE